MGLFNRLHESHGQQKQAIKSIIYATDKKWKNFFCKIFHHFRGLITFRETIFASMAKKKNETFFRKKNFLSPQLGLLQKMMLPADFPAACGYKSKGSH